MIYSAAVTNFWINVKLRSIQTPLDGCQILLFDKDEGLDFQVKRIKTIHIHVVVKLLDQCQIKIIANSLFSLLNFMLSWLGIYSVYTGALSYLKCLLFDQNEDLDFRVQRINTIPVHKSLSCSS